MVDYFNRLKIDPNNFFSAAQAISDIKEAVVAAIRQLENQAGLYAGKAGLDSGGKYWSLLYDQVLMRPSVDGSIYFGVKPSLETLVDALASCSYRLEMTGVNHFNIEQMCAGKSDRMPYPVAPTLGTRMILPNIQGEGSQHNGNLWEYLVESAKGDLDWPSGDPEAIAHLATVWNDLGIALGRQTSAIDSAMHFLVDIHHPKITQMNAEFVALRDGVGRLANACVGLHDMCQTYVKIMEAVHDKLINCAQQLAFDAVLDIIPGGRVLRIFSWGRRLIKREAAELFGIEAKKIQDEYIRAFVDANYESNLVYDEASNNTFLVIAERQPLFADVWKTVKSDVDDDFALNESKYYYQYCQYCQKHNKEPKPESEWRELGLVGRENAAKGKAYENYIAEQLAIKPGQDGWKKESADPNFPSRRLDYLNQTMSTAIEAKSGKLTVSQIREQLASDTKGLEARWSVKWIVYEDPSASVVKKFNSIKARYPNFSYEIIK